MTTFYNILLILAGLIVTELYFFFLARKREGGVFQILLGILGLLPAIIYLIWDVFKLSHPNSQQIYNAVPLFLNGPGEILAWFCAIVVPLAIIIALVALSKQEDIFRRIVQPFILGLCVVGINVVLGTRVVSHNWVANRGIVCQLVGGNANEKCQ